MISPAQANTLAVEYLASVGIRLLDREWDGGTDGQLDLVATEAGLLVVAKVQVSRSIALMPTSRIKRMRRLGVAWMLAHGVRFDQIRVDVISVIKDGPGGWTVEHVRNMG